MRITYIHHSSFLAELEKAVFYSTTLKESCRSLIRESLWWSLPATAMGIIFHR